MDWFSNDVGIDAQDLQILQTLKIDGDALRLFGNDLDTTEVKLEKHGIPLGPTTKIVAGIRQLFPSPISPPLSLARASSHPVLFRFPVIL